MVNVLTLTKTHITDKPLENRTREELIALVKEMIRQRPDLERLLELPSGADPADERDATVTMRGDFAERSHRVSEAALAPVHRDARPAGEPAGVAGNCSDDLGICLQAAAESALRETLLHAMFNVYLLDIDMGGVDLSSGIPEAILQYATADERRLVAAWIHERLPETRSEWAREAYAGFLRELEAERIPDEVFRES